MPKEKHPDALLEPKAALMASAVSLGDLVRTKMMAVKANKVLPSPKTKSSPFHEPSVHGLAQCVPIGAHFLALSAGPSIRPRRHLIAADVALESHRPTASRRTLV